VATGTLKKNIMIEEGNGKGRVGPAGIVYAPRREYENKKNPHRKFYMRRAFFSAPAIIEDEFQNAFQIVLNKIK